MNLDTGELIAIKQVCMCVSACLLLLALLALFLNTNIVSFLSRFLVCE